MYETLDDLEENIQNDQENPNNRKKRLKWILIVIGLIIGFGALRFLAIFTMDYFMLPFLSDTFLIIARIFSILIALFSEILIIYLILVYRTRKFGGKYKTKKYLKISLIVILPFLLSSIFAFFTKSGIIPNWFDVSLLSSENDYSPRVIGGCYEDFQGGTVCFDKPIIYLYPISATEVNVKLGTPEKLLHTYPKYDSERGRNIIAQPNGDLEEIETGRKLYALYREGKSDNETNFDEGFVVAGKNIIPFLEEKLAILGLNERETEEFIVYWLPQMENNERNLIRFETIEEQDENMPLNITPKPDTVIRIMMDWKAIDEPIDIPQQQLTTPERTGFTVVEWGGSPRN